LNKGLIHETIKHAVFQTIIIIRTSYQSTKCNYWFKCIRVFPLYLYQPAYLYYSILPWRT